MVVIGLLVILALGAVVPQRPGPRPARHRGSRRRGGGERLHERHRRGRRPAVVLYAVSTEWEHRRFVATFQVYAIVTNLASLVAKGGLPHVSPAALVFSFGGLAVGWWAGELLARHVDHRLARRLAVGLALGGAAFTVVKGVLAW